MAEKTKSDSDSGSGSVTKQPETNEKTSSTKHHYFDRLDWMAFWITFAVSLSVYLWTVAPDLTLEDSGELAVASQYAGVPHPPGYPIWTVYTWFFTKIIPFSNIAFRVAVSSAVAGVFTSAIIALIVSRGSRRLLRGISFLQTLPQDQESWIRVLSGVVSGMLLTFNSVLWSQSVIVEVYSFAACFFAASLLFLFKWTDSPQKNHYLYLCFLMFGVAVTNHQTLICAAMGIEVVIAIVRPALGRNFLAVNFLIFVFAIIYKAIKPDSIGLLDNGVMGGIFWLVGLSSFVAAFLMTTRMKLDTGLKEAFEKSFGTFISKLWKQSYAILLCGVIFILTHLTYIFMPLTSMTNPPMNWGYPRTEEGFKHAIFRGQYEPINPTGSIARFFDQSLMITNGTVEEFSIPLTILGLMPFFFIRQMRTREKGWWLGMGGVFIGVSLLLLLLLNPDTDAQSKFQTRVFFIPAHTIIAMSIGCAFALLCGILLQSSRRIFKDFVTIGGVAFFMVAFANAGLIFVQYNYALPRIAYLFVVAGAGFFLGLLKLIQWFDNDNAVAGQGGHIKRFMIAFGICMVSFSGVAHWSDSEQRGHLFGYWFGHDMFKPPFEVYPEMDKEAILFGGTDPGRFCPTYMIFSDSTLPPSKKRDPEFDRRDVYIITQNALADRTYLEYIRAHYNRSQQSDPPFFQELLRSDQESQKNLKTNFWARMVVPLDRYFTNHGLRVEQKRRRNKIYPEKEIYVPTDLDAAYAFEDYRQEIIRRLEAEGKVGVDPFANGIISGQESVMALNSRLAKVIFDKNPNHEFYIEESFPLEWMYPHLSPFGIIMKLNRNPLTQITEEMVEKDKQFWSKYCERLIGNWITEETSIQEVCAFAIDFLSFRDVSDYPTVNPRFFRDVQAQKSFSKIRGSQAELFAWRFRNFSTPEEKERMYNAALYAFKQAFSFYPGSPEAVYRLSNLLYQGDRLDEAIAVARTATLIDPKSANFRELLFRLEQAKYNNVTHPGFTSQTELQQQGLEMLQGQLTNFQETFKSDPLNLTNTISLIDTLWSLNQTNEALKVLDEAAANEQTSQRMLTILAEKVANIPDLARLEAILVLMTTRFQDNPSPFFDLATLQAFKGKPKQAITNMVQALQLNKNRLAVDPDAKDLREVLKTDQRFDSARQLPEYDQLIKPFFE